MKPTAEFFQTLGQYVYRYKDNEDSIYYTGKGNGDRCLSHVKDKDFDPEECYIVARNLEKFENKKDWQSFLLESFLIAQDNPESNSVSGHYKECFVNTKLFDLFSEWQATQYDNFEKFPEWYITHYDIFRGKVRELKINQTTTFLMSNARNANYMMFWWNANSTDPIKVTFEINQSDDRLEVSKETLIKWLGSVGYKKVVKESNVRKMTITVGTIEEVVELFKTFWKAP